MRIILVLGAFLASVLPAAAAAQGGSLTLDEALRRAQTHNPRLEALRAAARSSELGAPAASALPDPALQLGFMNLALPELTSTMAMSMAPSVQLTQMLPFPGKRTLRGTVADLSADMARSTTAEAAWQLHAEVASVFLRVWELDRHLEILAESLGLLREGETVAKAMYASGIGHQADVLRAGVEVARTDAELRSLRASRAAESARLNGLLNLPVREPVAAVQLPRLPEDLPPLETLVAWAEESRPMLERARAGIARAEAETDLANREFWPDLMVGLQYGQRDRGTGLERMGSAMVGFSLPLFAGSRQRPVRDAAEASARMARVELEELRVDVSARLAELTVEVDRTRQLIDLYRDEVLPQARATVASAFSAYRVGEGDFQVLLDALLGVSRFEMELRTLEAARARAVCAVEGQIGRTLRDDPVADTEGNP